MLAIFYCTTTYSLTSDKLFSWRYMVGVGQASGSIISLFYAQNIFHLWWTSKHVAADAIYGRLEIAQILEFLVQ